MQPGHPSGRQNVVSCGHFGVVMMNLSELIVNRGARGDNLSWNLYIATARCSFSAFRQRE